MELRLAASIREGTVSASLMLRNLGSYPRRGSTRTEPHQANPLHLFILS